MLRCILCKLDLAVLDQESDALEERMELQGGSLGWSLVCSSQFLRI